MSAREAGQDAPVTIRDVARVAEVHISTVSRALDPDKRALIAPATRERILAVAAELGYRPHLVASGLRRGQTRTVGVVVPDLGNPLYAPLVRGVAHVLGRDAFMALVADTEDDHENLDRVLAHLRGRRVDAVITTAPRLGDAPALLELAADGVPVVVAVRTLPDTDLPTVVHDDEGGGRLAAQHLLDLGHVRLAEIAGPADVEPFRARSHGFRTVVRAAGLELAAAVEQAPAPTLEEGARLLSELLDGVDEPPTALFAGNDMLALGALSVLHERGLACPDDVSLVGYNDAFFAAHTHPPLTTVRLPGYEIGEAAGRLALRLIRGEAIGEPPTLPPVLVVRSSTAAIGASG